jgi:hypothetical protein
MFDGSLGRFFMATAAYTACVWALKDPDFRVACREDLWNNPPQKKNTLWLFNIAMENGPFIDGSPIKNGDFPWLTVSHNQMINTSNTIWL